jgi:RimJ/RimL family protein N-acetyltransferase
MIAINPISGERIYLSSLDANGEFSHYVNWLNDPSVNSMLESRHQKHSFESVKEFVNNSNKSIAEYLFGIFLTSTNIHIGNIRLHSINFENRFGEIGLLIGETNEWGKGYAAEAISLILEFGYNELGLKTFGAGCYATNLASAKAFQKAGFFIEEEIKFSANLEVGLTVDVLRLKHHISEL